MASIVILGAGVTALTICQQLLGKQVEIKELIVISDYFPSDDDTPPSYASTRAGGHWRPIATNSPMDKNLRKYELETYRYFDSLTGESLEDGCEIDYLKPFGGTIARAASFDYWDCSPEEKLWFADKIAGFRELNTAELPHGVTYGVRYDSFVINCPEYIKWLEWKIEILAQEQGIKLSKIRSKVESFEAIHQQYPHHLLINCTSHSSRELAKDSKCFPVRGQVLLVDAPQVKRTITRITPAGLSYVIPRPGGQVVLGGSHWMNCWIENVDSELTEQIKHKTRLICPELGDLTGSQRSTASVGLRPGRQGGPRIDQPETWLINAYGLAGAGFQMSYGVAQEVLMLVYRQNTHPRL